MGGHERAGLERVSDLSFSVSGTGYNLAAADATQTVTVGPTLVGAANAVAVTIKNTAPADPTYTETLSASVNSVSTNFTATGSVSGIHGQDSDSGTLMAGLGSGLSAGHQSGVATLGLNSNEVNGSGLGTTSVGTQSVTIQGDVYDVANLQPTDQSVSGNVISFNNNNPMGSSALRASADVTSVSLSDSHNFSAGSPGVIIAGGAGAAIATIDATDKLNGPYSTTATVVATNVTAAGGSIFGSSPGDASPAIQTLSKTVTGQTSSGATDIKNAWVANGAAYTGYGLQANVGGQNTVTTILAGTANADGAVAMAYLNATDITNYEGAGHPGLDGVVGGVSLLRSDIVQVSGISIASGDNYVLDLTYNPASIDGADPLTFFLVTYDAAQGRWVNAIAGDTGFGDNADNYVGPLTAGIHQDGTFYANTEYNVALDLLGNYGTYFDSSDDTYHAWAVLNYDTADTEFAVVPEPDSLVLSIIGGAGLLGILRRRNRRWTGLNR